MSASLQERLSPARFETGRPQAFTVSTATVDYRPRPQLHLAHLPPIEFARRLDERLPKPIKNEKIGDKVTVDHGQFIDIYHSLVDVGLFDPKEPFARHVGGNSINVGHRLAELRNQNDGPVVVYTWAANDDDGELVHADLQYEGHWEHGLFPIINSIPGETPASLNVPRYNPETGKVDRTIFTLKPNMPSDFAEWLATLEPDEYPKISVLNSLTGHQWPRNLRRGSDQLDAMWGLKTYTAGSSQIKAVREGHDPNAVDAVYHVIGNTHLLAVNDDEMRDLLKGQGINPSSDRGRLARQGLLLGADRVLMTIGPDGLIVAEGKDVLHAEATEVEVVDLIGAGDAGLAGAAQAIIEGGSLQTIAELASANASYGVETDAAHDNLPNRDELEERRRTRRPRINNLAA